MIDAISIETPLTEEQKHTLAVNGFFSGRIIQGKLCALHVFYTTVGICIDIDTCMTKLRYCYPDMIEAIEAMDKLTDLTVHATGNWIKIKGIFNGQFVDDFNPEFVKDTNESN